MRDTVKTEHGACRLVAHRGASALERENTLAAFVAAGNRSYYGIETDVHPTLDGKLVIIHDADTARVAAQSVNVEERTYEELRDIRLKDLDGRERADLCLPLLEDYLRVARSYGKHCFIELKGIFSYDSIERMLEVVRSEYSLEEVTFIAFDLCNLIVLREILPTQRLQYLTVEINDEIFSALVTHSLGLDILHTALEREWVERLHASGIEINCWTVDDPTAAERLSEMGVDYITSNSLE